MKRIILASFILGTITTAAITTAAVANPVVTLIQQRETPIKVEELPDSVKKTIVEKFEGWTAIAATHVEADIEHYKVELKKDEEKKIVKIAKDGTIIE